MSGNKKIFSYSFPPKENWFLLLHWQVFWLVIFSPSQNVGLSVSVGICEKIRIDGMDFTAAGTAPEFHRIPYDQYSCKDNIYFDGWDFFMTFVRQTRKTEVAESERRIMENKGKITSVSLGPGEPELITLKALKALNEADFIFCPATKTGSGEIKSRSEDILLHLQIEPAKIRTFHVPMSKNREEALQAYDRVCEEMLGMARAGKTVAVTAEGDACVYSSANYMYEKLCREGYPVRMIAGVPAFVAASATAGLHLVKQQERLLVIPGDVIVEELLETVVARRTLVIMKVPLGEAILRPFIARHPELHYHYFEHVGYPEEFYTTDPECILRRSFTYFSLLIIKPA